MANIDFASYTLSELKGNARQQILAIAQETGVTIEELLALCTKTLSKAKGKRIKPQHHNPADKALTWTGPGRQPKWIAEGIAGGMQLADSRI